MTPGEILFVAWAAPIAFLGVLLFFVTLYAIWTEGT